MSLPHIILTVLSTRDTTGYDITKELSCHLGYSWNASHQQVYRDLKIMAQKNLVTYRLEPQEDKPDRKIYSITDLGQESLYKWFQEPARNPSTRDVLSAKLLICGVLDSEPMQQHIIALLDESHMQLNHYRKLEQTQFANYKTLDRKTRLERLTMRRTIHNRKALINWAKEVLAELKDLDTVELKAIA